MGPTTSNPTESNRWEKPNKNVDVVQRGNIKIGEKRQQDKSHINITNKMKLIFGESFEFRKGDTVEVSKLKGAINAEIKKRPALKGQLTPRELKLLKPAIIKSKGRLNVKDNDANLTQNKQTRTDYLIYSSILDKLVNKTLSDKDHNKQFLRRANEKLDKMGESI